ncbi:MAG: penicillin-binding protein 1C [Alphaproteobacteria bacterium]|nr:penicillin-binding protein 1C [Alphaproteobacteria bacterium]
MRAALAACALAAASAVVADRALPPDLSRAGETSTLVVDKDDRLLRAFTTADGKWRLAASPADVDPRYLAMLQAYEDRRFAHHPGIDPLALLRAGVQAVTSGRVVSGGSTLTMQTARLLEPRPRTVGAKLIEIGRALQLETRLTKDEILQRYLTLAPYGGNIEGVRAASLAWLGKEPKRLTLGEAALLVVMPQSPERTRPDRDPAAARAARDKVLRVLAERGAITAREAQEGMQEPVPARRLALPFNAPHLAETLRAEHPPGARIATTIDRALQLQAEQLAAREQGFFADAGNVAIVVVENATRAVRAWVAGADFHGEAGQVDLVRARRSPGSALKPFLYGLAFDEGWLHPETKIADVATRFGDFAPRNFDRGYQGEVTARAALQQSLNVPAVAVLDRLGPTRFVQALMLSGAALEFDRRSLEAPSLPVILGGVGISLADLTMLYAGIAEDGRARPLRLRRDAPEDGIGTRFLEPASALWLREILRGVTPPEPYAQRSGLRPIAYKTGTSYGFRDALAVGFSKRWTIGVWVGRADGTPRPGQYGRTAAAPILFKTFDLLPSEPPSPEPILRAPPPPRALARLVPRAVADQPWRDDARGVAILFPPDGATVELERVGDELVPLALKAEGGRGRLTWIVDGRPLGAGSRFDAPTYTPESEGFLRLVVVDESGDSAHATVRVVTPR